MKKDLVVIDGGLGNQMFDYAFCEALKSHGRNARLFYKSFKTGHYGIELERLFGIVQHIGMWDRVLNKFVYRPIVTLFRLLHRNYDEHYFIYNKDVYTQPKGTVYWGYWQSELYFKEISSVIRSAFKFKLPISSQSKKIIDFLKDKNSISIHVRRGDYIQNEWTKGFTDVCDLTYYRKAISYISNKVEEPVFIFFSDDIDWVKKNLYFENAKYIDYNKGVDSWQDMLLMSKCKHNIIANSSFSWWGAWLNENPHKIVIAPKQWWKDLENDDVVCPEWIRL